jgi:hypothetical protein
VWRGSHDIGKNNSKEDLKHLYNFIEKRQKANIVVMTAPPRYDLIPSSYINNEVVRFNRKLKERTKMYNNVKILETDLEREYFTKHGLHLNSPGEEQIALKLAAVVTSFFNKKKELSVCFKWKEDPTISYHDRNTNDLNTSNIREMMVNQPQFSESPKRNLSTGLQDLPSAINIPNNKEGTIAHTQLAKRQREKPALRD